MTETLNHLLGSTEQTFFLGSLLYGACCAGEYFLNKILGTSERSHNKAPSLA